MGPAGLSELLQDVEIEGVFVGAARPLAALAHQPDQPDVEEGLALALHLARRALRGPRDRRYRREDAAAVILAGVDQLEQHQFSRACAHVGAEACTEQVSAHSAASRNCARWPQLA